MRSDVTFNHEDIVALLGELGDDLADKDLRAEMFIVGGAAMALRTTLGAPPATSMPSSSRR